MSKIECSLNKKKTFLDKWASVDKSGIGLWRHSLCRTSRSGTQLVHHSNSPPLPVPCTGRLGGVLQRPAAVAWTWSSSLPLCQNVCERCATSAGTQKKTGQWLHSFMELSIQLTSENNSEKGCSLSYGFPSKLFITFNFICKPYYRMTVKCHNGNS